jgi:hypothetical protein
MDKYLGPDLGADPSGGALFSNTHSPSPTRAQGRLCLSHADNPLLREYNGQIMVLCYYNGQSGSLI